MFTSARRICPVTSPAQFACIGFSRPQCFVRVADLLSALPLNRAFQSPARLLSSYLQLWDSALFGLEGSSGLQGGS